MPTRCRRTGSAGRHPRRASRPAASAFYVISLASRRLPDSFSLSLLRSLSLRYLPAAVISALSHQRPGPPWLSRTPSRRWRRRARSWPCRAASPCTGPATLHTMPPAHACLRFHPAFAHQPYRPHPPLALGHAGRCSGSNQAQACRVQRMHSKVGARGC